MEISKPNLIYFSFSREVRFFYLLSIACQILGNVHIEMEIFHKFMVWYGIFSRDSKLRRQT